MRLDADFFHAVGPPPTTSELIATSGFRIALQRLSLDLERKQGTIRLVVGSRGSGKSTCLEYLRNEMERRRASCTVTFDAGIHLTTLASVTASEASTIFFEEFAEHISQGKTRDIKKVIDAISQQQAVYFAFIDNLDRLYSDQNALSFVEFLFRSGDPLLKALSKKMVIVISAAPEWSGLLQSLDLSYLNFHNRVELQSITAEELAMMIEKRAASRNIVLDKLFESSFIRALHLASGGSPRLSFQLLQTFNERPDIAEPPFDEKAFHRVVPEKLVEGAIEKLKEIAADSPKTAWGVNQLARFFDALDRSDYPQGKAIAAVLECYEQGQALGGNVPKAAWTRIAHRNEGDSAWILHDQVRDVLRAWGKTGVAKDILLTAFAETPFTTTKTDVDALSLEYQNALLSNYRGQEAFVDGHRAYMLLNSVATDRMETKSTCDGGMAVQCSIDARRACLLL